MELERLYSYLPAFTQNMACSIEGWRIQKRRYGAKYFEIASQVEKQSRRMQEDIRQLQIKRLSKHLQVAASCPYWANEFKKYGVDIENEQPEAKLLKLPILTKSIVQNQGTLIINPCENPSDLINCHTSGTTGTGLRF